jgi:hypothetical protein
MTYAWQVVSFLSLSFIWFYRLVLPLVIHEVVTLFHPGNNASETLDLSTYGFLYGVFPAAPGVFVFATQYSIDIDLVSEYPYILIHYMWVTLYVMAIFFFWQKYGNVGYVIYTFGSTCMYLMLPSEGGTCQGATSRWQANSVSLKLWFYHFIVVLKSEYGIQTTTVGVRSVKRPPCFPDLSPCVYNLIPRLKQILHRKWFAE